MSYWTVPEIDSSSRCAYFEPLTPLNYTTCFTAMQYRGIALFGLKSSVPMHTPFIYLCSYECRDPRVKIL
jgi:hypothetical protein